MQRTVLAAAVAAVAFLVGCGPQQYAEQFIHPRTTPGKVHLQLKGTGEQMVQAGRIDQHRRLAGADGVEIDVWVIEAKPTAAGGDGRATVLILHDRGQSKATYPCPGLAERLAKKGYDVVLPDLRYHGRSDGERFTYGVKEKQDLRAVLDALIAEKTVHPNVYAFGSQFGGMVAVQYAAFDPHCRGAVVLDPRLSLRQAARRELALLSAEEFEKVMQAVAQQGQFDPQQASAVRAAAELKVPLLVLGLRALRMNDYQTLVDMAAGPKELYTPALGEHGAVVALHEDWLADKVQQFIDQGLPIKPPADGGGDAQEPQTAPTNAND